MVVQDLFTLGTCITLFFTDNLTDKLAKNIIQ